MTIRPFRTEISDAINAAKGDVVISWNLMPTFGIHYGVAEPVNTATQYAIYRIPGQPWTPLNKPSPSP